MNLRFFGRPNYSKFDSVPLESRAVQYIDMEKGKITAVLGDLLKVAEDGKLSLCDARDRARRADLKALFDKYATQYEMAALELKQLSSQYGDHHLERALIGGAADRGWFEIRALSRCTDGRLLEAVERGQEQAKACYMKALSEDMPVYVRMVIERQAEQAAWNHDLIRHLREE